MWKSQNTYQVYFFYVFCIGCSTSHGSISRERFGACCVIGKTHHTHIIPAAAAKEELTNSDVDSCIGVDGCVLLCEYAALTAEGDVVG